MAVLLVLSCVLIARIRTRTVPASRPADGTRLLRETLAGFELLRRDRRAGLVVGLLGAELFVLGILDVVIVVLAFEIFASGESGTGLLSAAVGVGGLIGSAATVALIARGKLYGTLRSAMLLYGAPVALIAVAPVPGLAVPALAAAGVGLTVMDVTGRLMLQRLVPDQTLSRAFGVLEGAYMAAEGIGAVVGAALVGGLGLEATLIVAGVLLPAVAVSRGVAWRRPTSACRQAPSMSACSTRFPSSPRSAPGRWSCSRSACSRSRRLPGTSSPPSGTSAIASTSSRAAKRT